MRHVALVAVGYLLILTWSVAAEFLPVHQAAPDLALLVPLYLGLSDEGPLLPAIGASLGIGYLADVMGGAPHGLYSTAAVVICLFGHLLSGRFIVRGFFVVAITSFLASLLGALVVVSAQMEALRVHRVRDLLRVTLVQAGLTAVCAPACFAVFRLIDARRSARREARRAEGAFS